jgi:hypothetical protein
MAFSSSLSWFLSEYWGGIDSGLISLPLYGT